MLLDSHSHPVCSAFEDHSYESMGLQPPRRGSTKLDPARGSQQALRGKEIVFVGLNPEVLLRRQWGRIRILRESFSALINIEKFQQFSLSFMKCRKFMCQANNRQCQAASNYQLPSRANCLSIGCYSSD